MTACTAGACLALRDADCKTPLAIERERPPSLAASSCRHQVVEAEAFTDGVTISTDAHTAYEPDASVRLGPPLLGRE